MPASNRHYIAAILVFAFVTAVRNSKAAEEPATQFVLERLTGRVVWMAEALNRRHKIQVVPEAAERVLAIETGDGEIQPIIEDVRGRAFRIDPRLRSMDVELLARKYHGTHAIQIVRVYEIVGERKYVIDYWCDVCAIAMFEMGSCSCCQAENELRKRSAEDVE
jgi:hypothetical protein